MDDFGEAHFKLIILDKKIREIYLSIFIVMRNMLSCRVSPIFMSRIHAFHIEKIKYCKTDCEMHAFSSECMSGTFTNIHKKISCFSIFGENSLQITLPILDYSFPLALG